MKRRKPLQRRGRVRPANGTRRAHAFARNFGEEAAALRELPCVVASRGNGKHRCQGAIEIAHVVARGMGAAKGGRFDIVPLCSKAHRNAGEFSTKPDSMRWAFENMFRVDLRAEADRLALEHERPLGVRGLADRWAAHLDPGAYVNDCYDGEGGRWTNATLPEPLDTYETDALRGWVTREMAREVERRERRRIDDAVAEACQEPDGDEPWDGLVDHDRVALASHIAGLLGGEFGTELQLRELYSAQEGLAWSLCEWATEGRWVS